MKHTLTPENLKTSSIIIEDNHHDKYTSIEIEEAGNNTVIFLSLRELHSLIGTLLHVQSKLSK